MSKLSDATLVASINSTDEVSMLRPSGPAYTNIRSTVANFITEVLALIEEDTVTWASIDKTLSNIADLTNRSHTDLTGIGVNTHAQIDAFLAAHRPDKIITFAPVESDFDVKIREGTIAFTVPALLNGYLLTAVLASVHTQGAGSGVTSLQVRRRRAGTDVDMLGTKISISYNEYFAADGVVNTTYDDLATGDQIYVDVDELPSTPPTGLSIALTFSSSEIPEAPLSSASLTPSRTPSTSATPSRTPSSTPSPSATPSRTPSGTPSMTPSST